MQPVCPQHLQRNRDNPGNGPDGAAPTTETKPGMTCSGAARADNPCARLEDARRRGALASARVERRRQWKVPCGVSLSLYGVGKGAIAAPHWCDLEFALAYATDWPAGAHATPALLLRAKRQDRASHYCSQSGV
jgi:hypothetical protein